MQVCGEDGEDVVCVADSIAPPPCREEQHALTWCTADRVVVYQGAGACSVAEVWPACQKPPESMYPYELRLLNEMCSRRVKMYWLVRSSELRAYESGRYKRCFACKSSNYPCRPYAFMAALAATDMVEREGKGMQEMCLMPIACCEDCYNQICDYGMRR